MASEDELFLGEEKRALVPSSSSHFDPQLYVGNDGCAVADGQQIRYSKLRALSTSLHLYYLVVLLFTFAFFINYARSSCHISQNLVLATASRHRPSCGSSPLEARALGCVFDIYVNGWLPAACYDRAVAEQSESNSSDLYPSAAGRATFPIFWDAEMTAPATLDDVELAAFENGEDGFNVRFHIAWDYHRAHCLHLWRLAASALQRLSQGDRDVSVYNKVASPEHAWHCNKVIIEGDGREPTKNDTITPGIGRCTSVGLGNLVHSGPG
ncbi:hypothetical protein C8034_v005583 [Colletotrichum sidae]|uniref:Uncharacterized protein n=1 Tax=Colletotrichum sidae TaxID=1347389 RepID=A0A4R8T677_9PEZI|nr:hypothetical protein C8034_v005583 [Colletotrichum sidae]